MALTDASTFTDAMNQLLANSDWSGNRSAAADRKQALDWLLMKRPSYDNDGRSINLDYKRFETELDRINVYLDSAKTGRKRFARARVTGVGRPR